MIDTCIPSQSLSSLRGSRVRASGLPEEGSSAAFCLCGLFSLTGFTGASSVTAVAVSVNHSVSHIPA